LEKNENLPKSWILTSVEKIGELTTGNTPSKKDNSNYGDFLPWVKPPQLNSKYPITETPEKLSKKGAKKARVLKKDSVLVSCIGILGKIGIAGTDLATNQQINSVTFFDEIEPKYGYYFFKSLFFSNWLDQNNSATVISIINKKRFSKAPFILSPFNEQKRIVSKIEELFSELDNAKTILEKNKLQLKQYRQSILNAVVTGTIFGNDGKYEQIPLSKVTESLGQGWSPKCENFPSYNDEEWAVITTTSIQSMKFDDTQNKKLPNHLEPKIKLELKENDLLITRAGPRSRVGIACLVKKTRSRLLLCDKAYRIRFINKLINPSFFEIVLNSPHIIKKLDAMKTGTSDSGLNLTMKRFSNLIIPLPSLQQQHKIIALIEQKFSQIQNTENVTISLLSQLDFLRSSILKHAFEGELVPQDPNDEPASELLKRIKASK